MPRMNRLGRWADWEKECRSAHWQLDMAADSIEAAYCLAHVLQLATKDDYTDPVPSIASVLRTTCAAFALPNHKGEVGDLAFSTVRAIAEKVRRFEYLWGMTLDEMLVAFDPVFTADEKQQRALRECLASVGIAVGNTETFDRTEAV